MRREVWLSALVQCGLALLGATGAFAQVNVAGHPVQFHGFLTQGFAYSDANNYLTIPTSEGSFALTDGGVSVSATLNDKLRAGAQVYDRRVGKLGRGQVTLDWALLDFRVRDYFGIRAGKVKTVRGLYNDSQDVDALHTWALLPQSVYPSDLRDPHLSHLGLDVYGDIPAGKLGQLSYTAFAGRAQRGAYDGYTYGFQSVGLTVDRTYGYTYGTDLRWSPANSGLVAGVSTLWTNGSLNSSKGVLNALIRSGETKIFNTAVYAQYSVNKWRLDAEFLRERDNSTFYAQAGSPLPSWVTLNSQSLAWYAAAAYRVSKLVELGTYRSHFYSTFKPNLLMPASPEKHIFDQALTARLDFCKYVYFKIEGHLMDGLGDPLGFHGFYLQDNPTFSHPRTNLLVVRLGASF